ncbi:hypothetical protein MMC16_005493 [Acarospora aff. strigata]|nr:hypothetical protein [Acarospora aff. strigata]
MPKRKIVDQPVPMDAGDDGPAARRSKRRSSAGPAEVPAKRAHTARHDQETIVEETLTVTDEETFNANKHVHFSDPKPGVTTTSSVTTTTEETLQTTLAPAHQNLMPASPGMRASTKNLLASLASSSPGSNHHAKLVKEGNDTHVKRRSRRHQSADELNDVDSELGAEEVGAPDEVSVLASEEGLEGTEFPGYPNLETANLRASAGNDGNVMIVGAVEPINHIALLDGDHEATIKGLEHQIIDLEAKVQHWLIAYQSWLLKLEPYALMPSPPNAEEKMDHAVDGALAHLARTELRANDAEAALRALSEEIGSLGFEGEGVEDVLQTITEQFRQTRLALEHLAPGETVHGFNNNKLLQALMDRIRMLVEQVKEAEKTIKSQRHEQTALREQFNITLDTLRSTCEHVKELKSQVENQASLVSTTRTKLTGLEADVGEKERSMSMLQQTLEGYRTEVANLEKLITQLETDHKTAIEQLQREKSESVIDLECKVAAETKGRHAAEAGLVEKNRVVKDLEKRLREARKHSEDIKAEMQFVVIGKEGEVNVEREGRQAAEAALIEKNQIIVELERNLAAAIMNTEEVRSGLGALLVESERKLAEEKKGHQAAVAAMEALTGVIEQLEQKLRVTEQSIENATAALRAQVLEKEREVALEAAQRHVAENIVQQKTNIIAKLEKKLATTQKHSKDLQAELQSQLAAKENEVVSLQSAAFEKEQQYDVALMSRDRQADTLNLENSNLSSALAQANETILALQTANTALEASVVEEIELGTKAVELMQAEMMRSLARCSDVKNSYVRHTKTKIVNKQVVGTELAVSQGAGVGLDVGMPPSTPVNRNIVRFTDVEVSSSGKRQRVSRMNGDSGVGILDEIADV